MDPQPAVLREPESIPTQPGREAFLLHQAATLCTGLRVVATARELARFGRSPSQQYHPGAADLELIQPPPGYRQPRKGHRCFGPTRAKSRRPSNSEWASKNPP